MPPFFECARAQLILYGGKSGVPGAIEIHTGGVKSIGLGMRMYENGVTTFFGEKTTFKGQITATNCCTSSDIRLKKGIAPLTHSLNKITSLKGVSYYWKTDEYPKRNFEDTKQIGLIAQEVETIIPEAVHTDHEGYKSIRYNKLTPVLIEAVKELKTKNDCLQQQINSQQKEIDELKSLVNQLIKNI